MGHGSKSKSTKNNGLSRPSNGNGNSHVHHHNDTNNKNKKKKRHVTFHLSADTNTSRRSVAPKNGNTRSMALRAAATRPKQTRLQTFLLLSALFLTLPKLLYRVTDMYCGKDEEECQHQRQESFARMGGIFVCRMASVAVETYERLPGGRFMLGKSDDGRGRADRDGSTLSLHESHGESSRLSQPSRSEEDSKRGIIQRVVDRHRRQRQKRTKSKSKSPIKGDGILRHPHPLKRLLEEASVFSHWKKRQKSQQQQKQQQQQSVANDSVSIDWKTWKYAMSDDFELTPQQIGLIKGLATRVLLASKHQYTTQDIVEGKPLPPVNITTTNTNSFSERVGSVPWGGAYDQEFTKWWPRKDDSKSVSIGTGSSSLAKVSAVSEGGRLLAAYLKIMKWPKDLHARFPFKLCSKGCDSEIAVLHTLEWREKYLPWCMSPDSIQYNKDGFIYHHGHSRPGPQQRLEAERTEDMTYFNNAGHSMVWYRPGRATLENPELYIRALVHTLEMAVADSLLRNRGEIGRFNLVLDCNGIGTRSIPGMSHVKKLFAFLQDHFPDRLGVLLLANLSGVGRMVMNMVLPFVTDEVKAKIHVIPADEEKRKQMLTQFIDLEHVPDWAGGKNDYIFDIQDYYYGSVGGTDKCILSEDEIREYLVTMPYHA